MTSEELTREIERVMGKRGGSEMCRTLGINRTTLYRWQSGKTPIPKWVSVVLKQYDINQA